MYVYIYIHTHAHIFSVLSRDCSFNFVLSAIISSNPSLIIQILFALNNYYFTNISYLKVQMNFSRPILLASSPDAWGVNPREPGDEANIFLDLQFRYTEV